MDGAVLFNASFFMNDTKGMLISNIENAGSVNYNVDAEIKGFEGNMDDEKVNEWLRAGSSVDGYKGFAIGRSIFWESLKGWHAGDKSREEAVEEIANSYLSFISVYQNG